MSYPQSTVLILARPLPARSVRWIGALILLLMLLLSGCATRSEEPVATVIAETPAAATVPEEAAAIAPVATPVPEGTVPPPDLADRGPAAELEPIDRNGMYDAPPEMSIDPGKYYYATIMTNRGDIRVQLFAERVPKTVNNFVFLARQGFYDNTSFHRVIDGFMAQAGDPTGTGAGGPGYEFEDEFYPGLVFDQSGLLAMANRGPNTNGSQFFITFGPADWLNGGHTIFGKVIEGEEVLSRITRRDPNTQSDTPGDTIYAVTIDESDSSVLPTPTPAPPTPTPTMTPTPYAPTSLQGDRPLAEIPAAQRVNYFNTPPEMVIDPAGHYTATIRTSKGVLTATLLADQAPVASNNFVVLANLGFYDQTPISLVRPGDSIIFGAPDNNPLNDAGYKFPAEFGEVTETDIGAITYIPMEELPDGTILSSSSQLLIALIQPPPEAAAQLAFFAQIIDGEAVLNQLTTADSILAIEIEGEVKESAAGGAADSPADENADDSQDDAVDGTAEDTTDGTVDDTADDTADDTVDDGTADGAGDDAGDAETDESN